MNTINVMKLGGDATLPTRGHAADAGLDLYCSENVSYKPGEILKIHTQIAVEVPVGYVGLIRDRSSVGFKGLKVTAGVVDAGYTGEIAVVMLNLTGAHGCVQKGQKIAQLLIIPVVTPAVVEVTQFSQTERGEKGFGSTGG